MTAPGGAIEAGAAALARGELVIMPTETVYGLAGAAADPAAVARIYAAKGRPRFNPLIAHVGALETAVAIGRFDDRALAAARSFWPGPLTLVVPYAGTGVCDLARAGLGSVALRQPAHPLALRLLKAFGGALAAPSANRSGRPSPTRFLDAVGETGAMAAAALDGGPCAVGVESTVLAVFPEAPLRILRPGGVTREALEARLGPLGAPESGDGARSPGRLALHYAPRAPLRLNAAAPLEGEAFLAFGAQPDGPLVFNLSPSGDLGEAAQRLFACLRDADAAGPSAIAVARVPGRGLGEAINDRLERAAGRTG